MTEAQVDWSDPAELLSPESLTRLEAALDVSWPAWYRELVHHLMSLPSRGRSGRIYFPGGFLYDRPHYIYANTIAFRTGSRRVFDREDLSTPLPWLRNHVIVGDFGGACVVLDTTSDRRTLLCVESDRMTLASFIDELPHDIDWEAGRNSRSEAARVGG